MRAALDHGAAAFATSLLQSQPLVNQLLKPETPGGCASNSQESSSLLSPAVLATLSIQLNEEVTVASLSGLTQKMVSIKVDQESHIALMEKIKNTGEREIARMASLTLPQSSPRTFYGLKSVKSK